MTRKKLNCRNEINNVIFVKGKMKLLGLEIFLLYILILLNLN